MQLKPWSLQGKTSRNWNAGRTHKIDTWRYGFFLGNRWGHVVKFSGIVFFFFLGGGQLERRDWIDLLTSLLPKCCFHSRFGL